MADIAAPVLQPRDNMVVLTHVLYAMHAFSAATGLLGTAFIITAFLTGWPSVVAVVINYIKRTAVGGTYLESHFRWQIRTFWYAVFWLLISLVLAVTIVGIPLAWVIAVATGVWVLYRIARGWLALREAKPMPIGFR